MKHIAEIRLLPALAIARLGSSSQPMENYDLEVDQDHPIGPRRFVPQVTVSVNRTSGKVSHIKERTKSSGLKFRDSQGRIHPIAPFFEVWARSQNEDCFNPLTLRDLKRTGLTPSSISWTVHVANLKAFRRTSDPADRVVAVLRPFNHHKSNKLKGECANFLPDKSIPFGSAQYVRPLRSGDRIRLRFTPAKGKVYGLPAKKGRLDASSAIEVYDTQKGTWKGHLDPVNPEKSGLLSVRLATIPPQTFASDRFTRSLGYFDDTCDGVVEVEITNRRHTLRAHAMIVVAPPVFAPDRIPPRTVYDELIQTMLGPDVDSTELLGSVNSDGPLELQSDVKEIVRRALETVQLLNAGFWNLPQNGMAAADSQVFKRKSEPIMDPAVADSLAVQSRHERVLAALDSPSLAWFARVLRNHDQVGDLSVEGRRRMPALMRGSDTNHLALTRRQVNTVKAVANFSRDRVVGASNFPKTRFMPRTSPHNPALNIKLFSSRIVE